MAHHLFPAEPGGEKTPAPLEGRQQDDGGGAGHERPESVGRGRTV